MTKEPHSQGRRYTNLSSVAPEARRATRTKQPSFKKAIAAAGLCSGSRSNHERQPQPQHAPASVETALPGQDQQNIRYAGQDPHKNRSEAGLLAQQSFLDHSQSAPSLECSEIRPQPALSQPTSLRSPSLSHAFLSLPNYRHSQSSQIRPSATESLRGQHSLPNQDLSGQLTASAHQATPRASPVKETSQVAGPSGGINVAKTIIDLTGDTSESEESVSDLPDYEDSPSPDVGRGIARKRSHSRTIGTSTSTVPTSKVILSLRRSPGPLARATTERAGPVHSPYHSRAENTFDRGLQSSLTGDAESQPSNQPPLRRDGAECSLGSSTEERGSDVQHGKPGSAEAGEDPPRPLQRNGAGLLAQMHDLAERNAVGGSAIVPQNGDARKESTHLGRSSTSCEMAAAELYRPLEMSSKDKVSSSAHSLASRESPEQRQDGHTPQVQAAAGGAITQSTTGLTNFLRSSDLPAIQRRSRENKARAFLGSKGIDIKALKARYPEKWESLLLANYRDQKCLLRQLAKVWENNENPAPDAHARMSQSAPKVRNAWATVPGSYQGSSSCSVRQPSPEARASSPEPASAQSAASEVLGSVTNATPSCRQRTPKATGSDSFIRTTSADAGEDEASTSARKRRKISQNEPIREMSRSQTTPRLTKQKFIRPVWSSSSPEAPSNMHEHETSPSSSSSSVPARLSEAPRINRDLLKNRALDRDTSDINTRRPRRSSPSDRSYHDSASSDSSSSDSAHIRYSQRRRHRRPQRVRISSSEDRYSLEELDSSSPEESTTSSPNESPVCPQPLKYNHQHDHDNVANASLSTGIQRSSTPTPAERRRLKKLQDFDSEALDAAIYSQQGASDPPDGIKVSLSSMRKVIPLPDWVPRRRGMNANVYIHSMQQPLSAAEQAAKDVEIESRGHRKFWFGKVGARQRWRRQEDRKIHPLFRTRKVNNVRDISFLAEHELPDYIRENPGWMKFWAWLRGERLKAQREALLQYQQRPT